MLSSWGWAGRAREFPMASNLVFRAEREVHSEDVRIRACPTPSAASTTKLLTVKNPFSLKKSMRKPFQSDVHVVSIRCIASAVSAHGSHSRKRIYCGRPALGGRCSAVKRAVPNK